MRVRVKLDEVVAEGKLFEDQAPITTRALWARLPIRERIIFDGPLDVELSRVGDGSP